MENQFRDMFLAAVKHSGLSVREIARRSNIPYDRLKSFNQGKNQSTSIETAAKIAASFGVGLDDFLAGRFDSELAPLPPDTPTNLVSIYDVQASAGGGSIVQSEQVIDRLSFPPDYLQRLTRTAPQHLAIIGVKGDSMDPTLKDDDLVMLDTTKTSLDFDGLFVLRFGDALHVKRIGRAPNNQVRVISDNSASYPAIDLPRADIFVVGKVIWIGKKM